MEWLATIIVGLLSFCGVLISNASANRSLGAALERAQAVTDTKLDELTREVREHNNFARRVPVIEEQIKILSRRITNLEGERKQ